MLLIDAHVHIYDCFDLEKFFDSAYANFKSAAKKSGRENDFTGALLLAETSKDNWFYHLSDFVDGKDLPGSKETGNWIVRRTDEIDSLLVESGNSKKMLLIAGRQIVTREGLEVLACATIENFEDDTPIEILIKEIVMKDGLPIIPWGIGKWFGNKGKIIKGIINKFNNNKPIYLGDNGNRPNVWPQPKIFKHARQRGIRVLPGSDPLPFVSESGRAGSYGFFLQRQADLKKTATQVKQILMSEANYTICEFGQLEKNYRFLVNQMRAQIRKRFTGSN